MTEFADRPVVVGVDGSASGLLAARLAVQEAVARRTMLRVVHGFLWPTYQVPDYGELRRTAERIVAEAVAAASALVPGAPVSGQVVDGEPGAVLRVESRGAQLVVLGSSDPAHHRAAVDSVVEQVAARSLCPVVVAHPRQRDGGPVLVGVDGSADSAAAVRFAFLEAARRETELVAVYVERGEGDAGGSLVDAPAQAQAQAHAQAQARALGRGLVKVEQRWLTGEPGRALVNESATAQLVVVGARGHGHTLLGAVSYALLRNARCPVAVVRSANGQRSVVGTDAREAA
jgi:nucleotide-binding universal stress UspA family protein